MMPAMTWSLVAVDGASGLSGVAVASCVPLDVLQRVPGIADGAGALVTQSYLLEGQRDRGVERLAAGEPPAEVLAALLDPAVDPAPALRQIAIVGLDGQVAAHTGSDALPFAAHREVRAGATVASVQGNLLTGPEVLDEAARAFAEAIPGVGEAPACVLAERLLRGLEAGGRDGRGDARCVGLGPAAQSASLRVGQLLVEVGVDAPGDGPDPLVTARSALDAWRAGGGCAPATEGEGGAGGTAGGDASSGADVRAPEAGHDAGCGVAAAGAPLGPALLLVVVLGVRAQARARSGPGASHSMQRSTSSPNGPQSRHCDR